MLETSARLLRLLSLLQSPREWPGTELAERLGVSGRTVRNDIERLRTLGYPVDATRGSTGGYRLAAGAAMPPLLLEDDEAVAVTIAVRTVARSAMPGMEETSLQALAKLEQVLPSRLRRRVRALQQYTVPVPADREDPGIDTELLMTLASACRDRERLRLDYRDHAGTPSRRLVEPQRVVNWGRRWYLVAWDVDREDWRMFRVDRITPRTPAGPRFAPREDPEGTPPSMWRARRRRRPGATGRGSRCTRPRQPCWSGSTRRWAWWRPSTSTPACWPRARTRWTASPSISGCSATTSP